MDLSYSFIYFSGVLSGVYFLVTLVLGLQLVFDIFKCNNYHKTPFVRLVGMAILCDAVAVMIGKLLYIAWPYDVLKELVVIFDALVVILLVLSGFALLWPGYPKRGIVMSLSAVTIVMCAVPFIFPSVAHVCVFVFDGSMFVIAIVQVLMFRKYDKTLEDYYSDLQNRMSSWFAIFPFWLLLNLMLYYLLYSEHIGGYASESIYNVFAIVFNVILAYLALRQLPPEHINDNVNESNDVNKDLNENKDRMLTKEQNDIISERLKQVMEHDKVYLHPDLTTAELAKAINSNTNYLYYYMRDVLDMRFYEYVNGYRIEDAKKRMLATDEKLEYIAMCSGFRSYNTFAKVFRKAEGVYPSAWRIENRAQ